MDLIANTAILVGSMLIAAEIRLKILIGTPLGEGYNAQPFLLYPLIVLMGFVPLVLRPLLKRKLTIPDYQRQFIELQFSAILSFPLLLLVIKDLSPLQILFFNISAFMIGVIAILLPGYSLRSQRNSKPEVGIRSLIKNRALLLLWTKNNVRARYAQAVLGIVWIVLLPLAQAAIMAFVFSHFLRMDVGQVPYISFFFAALIPWTFFNQALMTSCGAILGMMGLINQIYFPREILVLVKFGEVFVDIFFMFLALVVVNLLVGIAPNINFLYLPLIFVILSLFSLGIALFLSYLSVIIRDIPQLLFVVLQLLFYVTPIIYPVSVIPQEYRFIALVNPLVAVVQACRDIIVYGQTPDLISLHYPLVVGVVTLYVGYTFFKASENRLADYV